MRTDGVVSFTLSFDVVNSESVDSPKRTLSKKHRSKLTSSSSENLQPVSTLASEDGASEESDIPVTGKKNRSVELTKEDEPVPVLTKHSSKGRSKHSIEEYASEELEDSNSKQLSPVDDVIDDNAIAVVERDVTSKRKSKSVSRKHRSDEVLSKEDSDSSTRNASNDKSLVLSSGDVKPSERDAVSGSETKEGNGDESLPVRVHRKRRNLNDENSIGFKEDRGRGVCSDGEGCQ